MTSFEKISLNLRPADFDNIDVIRDVFDIHTKSDAIRKALSAMGAISRNIKEGGRLLLEDPNGEQIEVIII